jgi:dimethylargininase
VALAGEQHVAYCRLLADCDARVVTLNANPKLPDAVFIEDTAIVLDEVAVLASMGAASRRAEVSTVAAALAIYRGLVPVELPATIEGGDVLRVGRTLLVGQSHRTNAAGIEALARIASPLGYRVVGVPVTGCLHLKTACTALPDGRLLVNPEWIDATALADFQQMAVDAEEPWGANTAIIGETVIIPAAHRRTIDISEFAKAEGGVTCLSLLIK